MPPVDLNALVQETTDELRATLTKLNAVLDALQPVIAQAVQVEKDADGVIKSVHIHWPI